MANINLRIPEAWPIEERDPKDLIPDPDNPQKHPRRQLEFFKKTMRTHGVYNLPIIDESDNIIAGHGRIQALIEMGVTSVPCRVVRGYSQAEKAALLLSDNKSADLSHSDPALLSKKMISLTTAADLEFDLEATGFNTGEIDLMLAPPGVAKSKADPLDVVPALDRSKPAISAAGDLWRLGRHALFCGNALSVNSYEMLLGGQLAQLVATDPPFNVSIPRHASGLGQAEHPDFAMASGEMSPQQFEGFLVDFMGHAVRCSTDGSLHYVFMDWRHMGEIHAAGKRSYIELKTLCFWNKTNGGMGSFYRSKHELVFVFKNGTAQHINNIDLGANGRYRTNVWDYPGANTFSANRQGDLAAHPTVKPLALIADIMRDASKRSGLVLDPFAGSGTVFLAAERTGRKAAGIEIDPYYVDVAISRWQAMTGEKAVRAADGKPFDDLLKAASDD